MTSSLVRHRVLLADEQVLFRAAIRLAIDGEPDLCVATETADGGAVVDLIRTVTPDVAVLSLGLHGLDGFATCEAIREADLSTRVVLMAETASHDQLVRAMEHGADGFVSRDVRLTEFSDAVRAVASGETCIPPRMLGGLLRELVVRRRDEDEITRRFRRLSRREYEVAALMAEGRDRAAIAAALVISPQTARTHIQHVLQKLEVHSRVEAVNLIYSYDLLDRFSPTEG